MSEQENTSSQWKECSDWLVHWLEIVGRDCSITLEPRPHYCDRGNWLAKLHPSAELARGIDSSDLWPRYYMDLERAKLEVQDWMKKRGEWIE